MCACLVEQTGRFAGDVSFNGNIDVSFGSAAKNPTHGFAFQLPTPAGDGPSPWPGGLLNIGSLMQSNGYRTAHVGKYVLVSASLSRTVNTHVGVCWSSADFFAIIGGIWVAAHHQEITRRHRRSTGMILPPPTQVHLRLAACQVPPET